jgi:hypothetical protein
MASDTPAQQQDFLDQDPPIRGQNFACVSFVSPEDVLQRKDVFEFSRFVSAVADDLNHVLVQLEKKYEGDADVADVIRGVRDQHAYLSDARLMKEEFDAYRGRHGEALSREFAATAGGATSIRGIKIRGVYDTLEEAKTRAYRIRAFDDKFNVYVAQVGCWCPWSPNPDEIEDSEYAESHLNSLMKSYKQNEAQKNAFYEKRKDKLIASAHARTEQARVSVVPSSELPPDAHVLEVNDVSDVLGDVGDVGDVGKVGDVVKVVEINDKVEKALDGLEGTDPWLARSQEVQ